MRRIAVIVLIVVVAAVTVTAVGLPAPAGAAACTKTWANTAASGSWDQTAVANGTETQWNPVGVPGPSDVVCLPGGNVYGVTITNGDASSYTIAELHVGSAS